MSRRTALISALTGAILAIAGLVARPANITVAVILFLLAVMALGLAAYGALERLVTRNQRPR